MRLNQIANNPGATRPRKRIGRGPASGTGKTAGKGHKGQKARSGVALNGFEGGQNSIFRRLPKRGFNNIFRTAVSIVNTGQLQALVDAGKLDTKKPITFEILRELGLVKNKTVVKVLARGELKTALALEVDRASVAAIQAIEKAKGSIKISTPEPTPALTSAEQ